MIISDKAKSLPKYRSLTEGMQKLTIASLMLPTDE